MADIMAENKITDYRKFNAEQTLIWLNHINELIAFIHTYGPLYDDYYFSYILNLHNLVEHYLLSNDYKIIGRIYLGYKKCIHNGKTDKETYNALRLILQQLPAYSISEVDERYKRHTKHK